RDGGAHARAARAARRARDDRHRPFACDARRCGGAGAAGAALRGRRSGGVRSGGRLRPRVLERRAPLDAGSRGAARPADARARSRRTARGADARELRPSVARGGRRAGGRARPRTACRARPAAGGVRGALHRLGYAEQHVRLQVYLHRLASRDEVVEWVKGTLLTDYQRRLPAELYARFVARYRERLLPALEDTCPYFFTFKRVLLWAQR